MRLQTRLLLAFVVVVLVAVSLSALVASTATRNQFSQYVDATRRHRVQQWEEVFLSYYYNQGNWQGVQALITAVGRGRGMVHGQVTTAPGERILLTTPEGVVVADSQRAKLNEQLNPQVLAQGMVLHYNNEPVGVLVYVFPPITGLETLERQFFLSVLRSILLGGLGAVFLAALLGHFFAHKLTKPLQSLTGAAQRLAGGDLSQRVTIAQDDEMGELGQSFNAMAQALEEHDRRRKTLLADVAHELRTPLAILQGNLESLQEGVVKPSPAVFVSLHDEALRLTRLVQDLQDLSLAEAGKLPLNQQPWDSGQILENVLLAVEGVAAEEGIAVNTQLPTPSPRVLVDQDRLAQILFNLLSNALRHTPPGGEIGLEAAVVEAGWLTVSITDSGPGINPGDLPFIFDRFFRSDQGRGRRTGGAGLGLAIAKGLVEAHGGRIWAENTTDKGACFTFTVPLAEGKH